MSRLDWFILFAGYVAPGTTEPPELSPVEIQKGLFLLQQVAALSNAEAYDYQAYDWGPVAPEIYTDTNELLKTHLLAKSSQGPFGRFWYYQATPTGRQVAGYLAEDVRPDHLLYVEVIRTLLKQLKFDQIVSGIYAAYPEWAVATAAPDLLPDGAGGAQGELAKLFKPEEIRFRADTLRGMREIERGQYVTSQAMAGVLRHGE
jgi:hypothetical protein